MKKQLTLKKRTISKLNEPSKEGQKLYFTPLIIGICLLTAGAAHTIGKL